MINDPAELLAQNAPREMFNFDEAPPNQEIGPIHAIYRMAGIIIKQFLTDALLLKSQMSVQEAGGPYLDAHGVFYGVKRLDSEVGHDDLYRARILSVKQKLTIAAIQAAVSAYYASLYPNGGAPIVTVYDLQSNPAQCAADGDYVDEGGTTTPIVVLDFVISIEWDLPADDGFFCDFSYLDQTTYLISDAVSMTVTPVDPNLVRTVLGSKSAGTHPVYRTIVKLVGA